MATCLTAEAQRSYRKKLKRRRLEMEVRAPSSHAVEPRQPDSKLATTSNEQTAECQPQSMAAIPSGPSAHRPTFAPFDNFHDPAELDINFYLPDLPLDFSSSVHPTLVDLSDSDYRHHDGNNAAASFKDKFNDPSPDDPTSRSGSIVMSAMSPGAFDMDDHEATSFPWGMTYRSFNSFLAPQTGTF